MAGEEHHAGARLVADLSVEDLARAYHYAACPKAYFAFHSCVYRNAHLKSMERMREQLLEHAPRR